MKWYVCAILAMSGWVHAQSAVIPPLVVHSKPMQYQQFKHHYVVRKHHSK
jgi:hypothetical protein